MCGTAPDHPLTLFNLGRLLTSAERFAEPVPVWERYLATSPSAESTAKYGEIVEHHPGSITFKVKRDRVISVCKALLDELPVSDIDIQEVPIEDVIRRIFAR